MQQVPLVGGQKGGGAKGPEVREIRLERRGVVGCGVGRQQLMMHEQQQYGSTRH
jgi:hypothetical protein